MAPAGLAILVWALSLVLLPTPLVAGPGRTITDSAGRLVRVPERVERVICSGAGCLRLLTYLAAHDRIVAVDSIELRGAPVDARPYAIANPQFRKYPLFGEFRGQDNPELIAALKPAPQVIFKTSAAGQDPNTLQAKTGIPVVMLEYGNLTYGREDLHRSLRLMGMVMGKEQRAETVISFFASLEQDLRRRSQSIPAEKRPTCYVGGLAQRGAQGFQSTEPSFAPFAFLNARNIAAPGPGQKPLSHAVMAREEILFRNPEVIFLDVSTLQLGAGASGLEQLRREPAYRALAAVRSGRVYGLFPYNSYTQNFEAIFANAYYAGKVLYPERFADVEPMRKAEEISRFLNNGPSFAAINERFANLAFRRIPLR
jgi:iron complex transport system substrate-binding protein